MFPGKQVLSFSSTSWLHLVLFGTLIITTNGVSGSTLPNNGNFSCYQCAVTSLYEKCGPETLKPCQHTSDRCVTQITRSSSSPLLIRRECGLGPCAFESENSDATAVLGMDQEHCDVTRPEVFCVLCCRESGCNTSPKGSSPPSAALLVTFVLWALGITLAS